MPRNTRRSSDWGHIRLIPTGVKLPGSYADGNGTMNRHSLLVLAVLACMNTAVLAQGAEPIGIVIVAKGQVQAREPSGVLRPLARYGTVYQADTILVGSNSMAHIRMADDALFAFKANTEFTFADYRYDGDAATADSAVMSMLRGGFRTMSGSIGDEDADTYRVDTPMASIGIRGTTYEALIVDDTLFTGVTAGGTTISNNAGSIDTGIGGDFDFSETRLGRAPEGLLFQPVQLNQVDFTALAANETQEANPQETTGETEAATIDPEPAGFTAPATEAITATADSSVAGNLALPGNDPDSEINPLINSRDTEDLIVDSGGTLPPPGEDPGNTPEPEDNDPDTDVDPVPDPGNNPDLGSNDNNPDPGNEAPPIPIGNDGENNPLADYNGNGLNPNPGYNGYGMSPNPPNNSNGQAPNPGNNGIGIAQGFGQNPAPGNNGYGLSPNRPAATASATFTKDVSGSSANALPRSSFNNSNNDEVADVGATWGAWLQEGRAVQRFAGDDAFSALDTLRSVFAPANLADTAGVANYRSSMFEGSDETGRELLDVSLQFTIDFLGGPAAVSNGSLHVIDSDQGQWNVSFDGALHGANVVMDNIVGTFTASPQPVTGGINGFFTGAGTAPTLIGGFAIQAGGDQVEGLVIADPLGER